MPEATPSLTSLPSPQTGSGSSDLGHNVESPTIETTSKSLVIQESIASLSASLSDRVEFLAQELRARWRVGRRITVETLGSLFDDLARNEEQLLDLIYHEILIREEFGETPTLAEYTLRFPQHAERLERLFAVHGALDDDWGDELNAAMGEAAGPALDDSLGQAEPSPGLTPSDSAKAHWPRKARSSRAVEPPPGYELLEEIGRGGMAVVFRAKQQILNRVVALKMLLGGGVASTETLARLKQEARAVAQLQHPGIVQIHEVGEHQGLPYLSLEYVSGGTLHDWLRGRPLSAQEAARIIEQLARTIAFAHERGIVHRDLKPANVLLTEMPAESPSTSTLPIARSQHQSPAMSDIAPLKISDFGLARMGDSGSDLTATGQVLGTPSYMAPEQAAGTATAASPALDLYSLGAILYELLTGRPPFRGTTVLETLEQVRHDEPVPPRQLQPRTPRDIETICLKCLEKSPDRRYSTALELAADLRRFLDGESISARPTGLLERSRKLLQKNPAVASLTLVVVLLVVFGLWAILNEARRANLNEQAALADSRTADQERATADSERQKALTAATAADEARQQAEAERERAVALQAEAEGQRTRAVDAQAEAEVALERTLKALNSLAALGTSLRTQPGQEQIGRQLLDETLALYEELLKDQQDNPAVRRRRVVALSSAGEIHRLLHNDSRAEELLKEAARVLDPDLSTSSDPVDLHHRAGRIWWNLGVLQKDHQRWAEALASFEKSLAVHDAGLQLAPENFRLLGSRMNLLTNICVPLRELKRPEEAAKVLEQAVAVGRQLVQQQPAVVWAQSELALAIHDRSMLLRQLNRPEEADKAYAESLALRHKIFAADPKAAVPRVDLARSWFDQASRDIQAGKLDAAIALLQQAEDVLAPLVEQSPDVFEYQDRLIGVMALRLDATIKQGHREVIEATLTQYCERLIAAQKRFPTNLYFNTQGAEWLWVQGNLLWQRGDEAGTERVHRVGIASAEALLKAVPPSNQAQQAWQHQFVAMRLGMTPVKSLHQPERAIELAQRAVDFTPNNSRFVHTLGCALYSAGRYAEAKAAFQTSVKQEETDYRERLSKKPGAVFSQSTLESTRSYHTLMLVNALLQLGEHDEAKKLFKSVDPERHLLNSTHTDFQRQYRDALKLLMP